jgi:type IV pilus assembly protein PilB
MTDEHNTTENNIGGQPTAPKVNRPKSAAVPPALNPAYKPQPKNPQQRPIRSAAPQLPEIPTAHTMPQAPVPQQGAPPAAPKGEPAKAAEAPNTMPLGQKLLLKGLISKDQLETALTEHKNRTGAQKKMLGAILIEMGFITESTLGEILTESSGVTIFDIKKMVLDPKLIKHVPKEVAVRFKAVPVSVEKGAVKVAITDIYNILAIDQIRRYFPPNLKIIPVYASEPDLLEVIDQYYGYETSIAGILKEIETGISTHNELSGETEGYTNPTVRLVDAILVDAIKRDASDIHFEPEGNFVRLRYRLDGKLVQTRSFHKDYWPAVVVRIKIMSGMNIAETRNPQDGRTSYFVLGRDIDFRVATHPTVFGENIVMRILDKHKALVPLEKLGFTKKNDVLLKKLLKRPEGIIIVTGPTGSGKTTTLYSILSFINSVDVNIMTLENPVEYQLPMLRQSDVKDDKGMDFVSGTKSLMRQDPDIIFIGEVRDEATANMAMRAAMTGHRVFTTLHTNDAVGAIPRLVDIGIPPHMLAGALICIVAQRLLRKLCEHCKVGAPVTAEEAKIFGIERNEETIIYHHKGCERCYNTGYKGRIAAQEIFPVDKGLDELIATGATRKVMISYATEHGFIPMVQDGISKVLMGITDLDELIRTIDMTERL